MEQPYTELLIPVRDAKYLRPAPVLLATFCGLVLAVIAYQNHGQALLRKRIAVAAHAEHALPQRILWVWERPEDLHTLDPATAGVAVLQQSIRLGSRSIILPRHQPTLLPTGIQRITVVRIETTPDFAAHHQDRALFHDTLASLQQAAGRPGIAALQIDFDARRSERPFYRALLTQLRQTMPPNLPLDITALVSWCSTDDWIADLPINAATPMFFRMEPDRRRTMLAGSPAYRIRDPLCETSLGVSTMEPWPANRTGKRLFIFPDHGWSNDIAQLDLTQANHP